MSEIIDVSFVCGGHAAAIAAAGVRTVIRYYSRDTIRPTKRLTSAEAQQFAAASLRIGIVHEGRRGDTPSNFDHATGLADAQYARTYGAVTIHQPGGSTIYFGADFDATASDINNRLLPYFRGISDAWALTTGEPDYVVGVYGSGATCRAMLDAGLAQRAWLAQSTGWAEYKSFAKSGRWSIMQGMPTTVATLSCDPDDAAPGQPIGDFTLGEAPLIAVAPPPIANALTMRVNARHGLNLRSGPGVEFNSTGLLPLGATLHPIKSIGNWTMVDCQGDGIADGFVSSAYLSNIGITMAASAIKLAPTVGCPDAAYIPELIRQGSAAEGLKAAREKAKKAWSAYPKDGCAAHLSALLEQAGIDVPMTLGAGDLAHVIAKRGWTRIAKGAQRAGDVGVTFDNDPTPPGADHIYLVIQRIDDDEMVIADNQRTTDATHSRFVSGRGKTPTEYFLRAV